MTEANKKSFRDVAIILGAFAAYGVIAHIVPAGSILQKIIGGLMLLALIAGIIWFTALGNPIKRFIRKMRENKEKK